MDYLSIATAFILGITATAAVSCACWYSVVIPMKKENQRLCEQITQLNEQIIQGKQPCRKILF